MLQKIVKSVLSPKPLIDGVRDTVGAGRHLLAGVRESIDVTLAQAGRSEPAEPALSSFYGSVEHFGRTEIEIRSMARNFSILSIMSLAALLYACYSIAAVGLVPANFAFFAFATASFFRYAHYFGQIECRELFPMRQLFRRIFTGEVSLLRIDLPAGWRLYD